MLNLQTSAPSLKTLAALGAAALLAMPLAAAAQNVYRCPNPDGGHNYTDKPCSGSRLRINSKGIGTSVKHDPVMRAPARVVTPTVSAAASSAPAPAASAAPAPTASAAPAPAAPTPAKPSAQGVQL